MSKRTPQLLLSLLVFSALVSAVLLMPAPPPVASATGPGVSAVGWVGDMYPVGGSMSTINVGDSLTVYLQVWKDGVTNQPGPGADITCTLHWGQVSAFGGAWTNITDTAMSYNVDIGNNDEYLATITPGAGLYEFTGNCTDLTDGTTTWRDGPNGLLTVNGPTATPTPSATPGPSPTPTPTPSVTPTPDPNVPRTVMVHLFEWRWDDIADECENFLGPKGFQAVQVSPPAEHRVIEEENYPWWQRYQPVSYLIESRSGDRAAFADMVQRCNAVGVEIYVDAVINHMSGLPPSVCDTGSAGTAVCQGAAPGVAQDYPTDPGSYDPTHFNWYSTTHACQGEIVNWDDPYEARVCELLGLDDLDQSQPYVQAEIAGYLNDLISLGVGGFRMDAAKHMYPSELSQIMGQVTGTPHVFQEVIQSQLTDGSDYLFIGDVTEFRYGEEVKNKVQGGNIKDISFGWMLPGESATVFIDNHDTQRQHALTYKDPALYTLANVYMLAHPYGHPKVMSSFYFDSSNTSMGPPTNGGGDTRRVYSGGAPTGCNATEWVCEHRWTAIANMVGFRNHTSAESAVTQWWDNGYDQVAFGRGSLGFVVLNRNSGTLSRTFSTGLAAGDYCDVIHGELTADGLSCTGPVVTVDGTGAFTAAVAGLDALALHFGARVGSAPPPCSGDHFVTLAAAGTVGGVAYEAADIVAHDSAENSWCLYFDGSAHGLDGADIDAFTFYQDKIILSLAAPVSGLPGPGLPPTVESQDLIMYRPATDDYTFVFDGSDVGLDAAAENIDGVTIAGGTLVISTGGAFDVPGVTGTGADVITCNNLVPGNNTSCVWAMYFDGSDIGLPAARGVDAVARLGAPLLLSLDGALGSFDAADTLACVGFNSGSNTSCGAGSGLYWDASVNGLSGNVNGLHYGAAAAYLSGMGLER